VLPGPVVRADLTPAASLAAPDEDCAPTLVEVGLGERERERLADAQTSPPQHDNQATQTLPVDGRAGSPHDGHDLLHGRRVGRIAHPLVARWSASANARQRGGRAATTGGIEQKLRHEKPPRVADTARRSSRARPARGYRNLAEAPAGHACGRGRSHRR
jgi:hypothetical protein